MLVTLLMVFGSKKRTWHSCPCFLSNCPYCLQKAPIFYQVFPRHAFKSTLADVSDKICQQNISQIADFNGTLSSLHNDNIEKQPWASSYVKDSASVRYWALLWAEGKGYFFPLHLHTVGTKSTNGQGQAQTTSVHRAHYRSWNQWSI